MISRITTWRLEGAEHLPVPRHSGREHEADDERLAEIGLERSLVVKHAPVKITDPIRGKHVIAAASESLGAKQSEGGK